MCDQAPSTIYGSILRSKVNADSDLAQAVGQIVYSAQAIIQNAADKVGGGEGWAAWLAGWLSNRRCCRRSHLSSPLLQQTPSPQILPDRAACLPPPTCPCPPAYLLMLLHCTACPCLTVLPAPACLALCSTPLGACPTSLRPTPSCSAATRSPTLPWGRASQVGRLWQRGGGTGAPGSQACVIVWHTNLLALLLVSSVPAPAACCSASLLPGSAPCSQPSPLPACFLPPTACPPAVLAQSGEVFSSLPSALPTFDQWLNYSAGVNINKTIEVGAAQGLTSAGVLTSRCGDSAVLGPTAAAVLLLPNWIFLHALLHAGHMQCTQSNAPLLRTNPLPPLPICLPACRAWRRSSCRPPSTRPATAWAATQSTGAATT